MSVTYRGVRYFAADAHTHIYPEKIAEKATASVGSFYGLRMHHVGLPSVLAETGGRAGIDRFLVCSVATKVEQVPAINRFIESTCQEYPAFVGLAAWHQDVKDVAGEVEDIQRRGLRGIKLHPDFQEIPIDAPSLFPLYREAVKRQLPILLHTGDKRKDFSSPCRLARVLDKLPEMVCIAAHLGGYTQWQEARNCLQGAKLYTDVSSSLPFLSQDEARASIEHFGIGRVMFGTDFPMWPVEQELKAFFSLELGETANRKILFSNFAELFGLAAPDACE